MLYLYNLYNHLPNESMGMRQLTLLCLVCILAFSKGRAQNLVPNPSFEDYYSCPYGVSMLENLKLWYNPTSYSPDYFNVCDTNNFAGVPFNTFGNQVAHTGSAYAGIITMIETDSREYLQCELIDSLETNKIYQVSFYVSAADISTYAAENIGAYFSDTALSSISLTYLNVIPQISNDPITNKINDTVNWTLVTGNFKASGGERFMTIGNFYDDNHTDTTHLEPQSNWWNASYHYIDDISVTCIDCISSSIQPTVEKSVSLYPNPANNELNIISPNVINSVCISNFTSSSLIVKTNVNSKYISINTTNLASGYYIIQYSSDETISYNSFFISH